MDTDRLWRSIDDPRRATAIGIAVVLLVAVPFVALAPDEPPYPEKPGTFTNESAVEYVSAYERATVYRSRDPPDGVDLHLDCPAALDRATEEGYYVTVTCWGSSSGSDGSGFGTPRSFYLVNETSTTRIETEDGRNGPGGEATGTFYLTNFDRRTHSIHVEIRPADGEDDDPAFDHTNRLRERSGIGESHLVEPGRYVVVATLESNERAAFEWNVTDDVADRSVPAFYVTPGGELIVRPVPEPSSDSPVGW